MPTTADEWKSIAAKFEEKWNFPLCLGALDGKHVHIKAPPNSGSLYFNYKHTFSMVLMALVDANYKFIFADIGAFGKCSDGGIFSSCELGKGLANEALNIPDDEILPKAPQLGPMPYVIVADEAFPLSNHIMRPFPGRKISEDRQVYNYRLSRARRVVENAFGILSARFRVLFTKIDAHPHVVRDIVKATCVLHNMLSNGITPAEPARQQSSNDTDGFLNLQRVGNKGSQTSIAIRDKFCSYFNENDRLTWQLDHVQRGKFV